MPTPAATTVISLAERRQRARAASDARQALRDAIEVAGSMLFSAALDAATTGPWREWSDAQPVGMVVEFDSDDLAQTPDPAIAAVGRALALLAEAQAAFASAPSSPAGE